MLGYIARIIFLWTNRRAPKQISKKKISKSQIEIWQYSSPLRHWSYHNYRCKPIVVIVIIIIILIIFSRPLQFNVLLLSLCVVCLSSVTRVYWDKKAETSNGGFRGGGTGIRLRNVANKFYWVTVLSLSFSMCRVIEKSFIVFAQNYK